MRPVLTRPTQLAKEMSFRSNWNLERSIFHSLSRQQTKLRFFPYPAFSVREWRGSTSWSKGKWSFRLGCFVKYASEHPEVHKLVKLMNEGVNWPEIISCNSAEQNGAWALNAFLKSSSNQILRLNGQIVGLTFLRQSGMLAVTASDICPIWKDKDAVSVTYENGKYTINSKKDGMYYCANGENILKSQHYNENCAFKLDTSFLCIN